MNLKEFIEITGVPVKTAHWVYNINHTHICGVNRDFNDADINYVLSRKLENYSDGRITEIQGYPGRYISDTGHVYTNARGFLEEMVGHIVCGYHYVGLTNEYGTKDFRVHRLVAIHFIPNPYNKPTVNHIDGDKLNNHYSNLEWSTFSENTKHAFDNGLAKNDKGFDDSQSISVVYIDKDLNVLNIYGSISEASRELKIGKSNIARQAKRNQYKIDNGIPIDPKNNTFIYYENIIRMMNRIFLRKV